MTNDTRSPEDIERDIERERAGLTSTLENLQERFSVEYVARQLTDQFRDHGGDIGRSVSDAVKRNPVALALTGVGIAWLMMGDRSVGRDRNDRDRSVADDRHHDDRVGRTGLRSRAAHTPQARSLGPQPGVASSPITPVATEVTRMRLPGRAGRMTMTTARAAPPMTRCPGQLKPRDMWDRQVRAWRQLPPGP